MFINHHVRYAGRYRHRDRGVLLQPRPDITGRGRDPLDHLRRQIVSDILCGDVRPINRRGEDAHPCPGLRQLGWSPQR